MGYLVFKGLISTADAGEFWPVHSLQKSPVSNDLQAVWQPETAFHLGEMIRPPPPLEGIRT